MSLGSWNSLNKWGAIIARYFQKILHIFHARCLESRKNHKMMIFFFLRAHGPMYFVPRYHSDNFQLHLKYFRNKNYFFHYSLRIKVSLLIYSNGFTNRTFTSNT